MSNPQSSTSITQKPHCSDKDKFAVPNWAGMPPHGTHLDCMKGDKLVQKLFIDELSHYYFGRNVEHCEVPVEHASCSRIHALLVFHKLLNRFALVDMGSSHGTFVSDTRISPMKLIFLDIGTKFHFGASTRRFIIREKYEAKVQEDATTKGPAKQILPENEEELDHLTEYNTAQNLRIPVIEQTLEEARAKRKPRNKIVFAAEDMVIDLDAPTMGRFANLVQTAIVPRKRKLDDVLLDFPSVAKKPNVTLRKLSDFAKPQDPDEDNFASILGVRMNAAPDLDQLDEPTESLELSSAPLLSGDDEHHQHKKYVKEVWPGRKPAPIVG